MVKRLLQMYRAMDSDVAKGIANSNLTPSCKKGCTHCCYQMVAIHHLEAKALAQAIVKLSYWRDIVERAHSIAVWQERNKPSRLEYYKAQRACPLLDLTNRECTVYDSRPAVCRYYLVVTDPALCSVDAPTTEVGIINLARAEVMCLDYAIQRPDFYVAPLPLSLLYELARLPLPADDLAYMRRCAEGLQSPKQWYESKNEQLDCKDTDEVIRAYQEAAEDLWGPVASEMPEDL